MDVQRDKMLAVFMTIKEVTRAKRRKTRSRRRRGWEKGRGEARLSVLRLGYLGGPGASYIGIVVMRESELTTV